MPPIGKTVEMKGKLYRIESMVATEGNLECSAFPLITA